MGPRSSPAAGAFVPILLAVALITRCPVACSINSDSLNQKAKEPNLRRAADGVAPEPKASALPRRDAHISRGTHPGQPQKAGGAAQAGGAAGEEVMTRLADAEQRATTAAKRAEAARQAARTELQKTTKAQISSQKRDALIERLQGELQHTQDRAERAEAAEEELRSMLQSTDQKLKKAEVLNIELKLAKAQLEGKLRQAQDDHASALRRASSQRGRLDREAAREAAKELFKDTIEAQEELGKPLSQWIPPALLNTTATVFRSAKHHKQRASAMTREMKHVLNMLMTHVLGSDRAARALQSITAFQKRAGRDFSWALENVQGFTTVAYGEIEVQLTRYIGPSYKPHVVQGAAVFLLLFTGGVGLLMLRCVFKSSQNLLDAKHNNDTPLASKALGREESEVAPSHLGDANRVSRGEKQGSLRERKPTGTRAAGSPTSSTVSTGTNKR